MSSSSSRDASEVCPELGLTDHTGALKKEEDRITKRLSAPLPGKTIAPVTNLFVFLEGLPAEKVPLYFIQLLIKQNLYALTDVMYWYQAAPVKLTVNGKLEFQSDCDGDISATVDVPLGDGLVQVDVRLDIELMEFNMDKKIALKDGAYLKFAASDSGLAIKQQTLPF